MKTNLSIIMSLSDTAACGATSKTTKTESLFKSLDPATLNFRPADSPATARDHGNTGLPGNEFMLGAARHLV